MTCLRDRTALWSPIPESPAGAGVLLKLCALGLAGILLLATEGFAQSNQSLIGFVQDSASGAPIEDVALSLSGTTITTRSGVSGRFVFRSVPAGAWRIDAERVGYRQAAPVSADVIEGFERRIRVLMVPVPIEFPPQTVERKVPGLGAARAVRRYTRSQIVAAGHESVAEALDAIPGVRVVGSSETPGGTRVTVAGEDPIRVAVLWDGLPLAAGADGSVDLDAIPLSMIAVIDVAPGGQSASSGDAAVGGAINLRSRVPGYTGERQVELAAGQDDVYRAAAGTPFRISRFRGEWAAQRGGRGSTFTYPDGDSSAVRYGAGAQNWRTNLLLLPAGGESLRLSAFWYQAANGLPGAVQDLTPAATGDNQRLRIQTLYNTRFWRSWEWGGGLWFESSSDRFRSPQRRIADSEIRERFVGGRVFMARRITGFSVRLGTEARRRYLEGIDHQRPRLSFGRHQRTELRLYGSANRTLAVGGSRFTVSLATAVDTDDRSSPFHSPRLDFGWTSRIGIHARAGWGRSFRRPLLTSLFWKVDAFAVGNPLLRPERASEWDIGFGFNRGGLTVDTRYFERDVRDIIYWLRSTATGQYKPGNVTRAFLFGREDHVGVQSPDSRLALDYVHVFQPAYDRSGEVNIDGDPLVLHPRHTHEFRARGRAGRWGAQLAARWVSERYLRRDNQPDGKALPPYRAIDVFVRFQWRAASSRISTTLRLDNLTNEHIELLERYPSPGRTWSLTTNLAF